MTTFLELINEYNALALSANDETDGKVWDDQQTRMDAIMDEMQDKSILVASDDEAREMLRFASEHFPHGGSVALVEAVAGYVEGDICLTGLGEIAKELDELEHQAEYWLKNGTLPASQIKGQWVVMRSVVRKFLRRGHA